MALASVLVLALEALSSFPLTAVVRVRTSVVATMGLVPALAQASAALSPSSAHSWAVLGRWVG